jgi:NADP-dependent 3-hydroxy acid dehydrogenase YdfG
METGMEFKSVAITGHTTGIGKGLYDYFISKGCTVQGFSKSNGYDISCNDDILEMLEQTKDFDLFINNAYYDDQQATIALQWHRVHYDKEHYIINMSSLGSSENIVHKLNIKNPQIVEYGINKMLLNNVGNTINLSDSKARCITVMPGIVNTDFISTFPFDEGMAEFYQSIEERGTILEVRDVVDSVANILALANPRNFISSTTIQNG